MVCSGNASNEDSDHVCLLQEMEAKKFVVEFPVPGWGGHGESPAATKPTLKQQMKKAEKQIEDDALLFSTLQAERNLLKDSNDKLSHENEQTQKDNEGLKKQIEGVNGAGEELARLQAEEDAASKKATDLENELISLKTPDQQIKSKLPGLSRNAEKMSSYVNVMKQDLQELSEKNQKWKGLLASEQAKVQKVTQDFMSENHGLHDNVTNFLGKAQALKRHNEVTKAAILKSTQEKEKIVQTMSSLQTENQEFQSQYPTADLANKGLSEENEMMKQQVREVLAILKPLQ